MTKPHVKDLIKAVRELAIEHPNKVYLKVNPKSTSLRNNCSYTIGKCTGDKEGDEEGCIFGRGFRRIGFVLPETPKFSSSCENDLAGIQEVIREYFEYNNDLTYIKWCKTVQYWQDNGLTWAQAILSANNQHSNI